MSKVKIMSDSTCDLSAELLAQFDVAVLPASHCQRWRAIAGQCDSLPQMIFTVIMNRQADYVRHLRRMPMTMRCAGNPWLDEGYEIGTLYNQFRDVNSL